MTTTGTSATKLDEAVEKVAKALPCRTCEGTQVCPPNAAPGPDDLGCWDCGDGTTEGRPRIREILIATGLFPEEAVVVPSPSWIHQCTLPHCDTILLAPTCEAMVEARVRHFEECHADDVTADSEDAQ